MSGGFHVGSDLRRLLAGSPLIRQVGHYFRWMNEKSHWLHFFLFSPVYWTWLRPLGGKTFSPTCAFKWLLAGSAPSTVKWVISAGEWKASKTSYDSLNRQLTHSLTHSVETESWPPRVLTHATDLNPSRNPLISWMNAVARPTGLTWC